MNQNTVKLIATTLSMATLFASLSGCATPLETEESTTPSTAVVAEVVATEVETVPQAEATAESQVMIEIETPDATEEVEAPAVELIPEAEEADVIVDIELTVVPLSGAPVVSTLMPVASGVTVYANTKAEIDASNIVDGYVMIRSLEGTTAALKVIVTGPTGINYYYDLTNDGSYEVFPLSDGNGTYKVQVCKNVTGTSYAVSHSATFDVALANEFAPFLLPNQYVNYSADSAVVAKAAEILTGVEGELAQIQAVYNYVVGNFTYDKERAATVTSGYLPDLDSVLAEQKGICFDYAALMTAMLRSQGIPCKLVIGYAGTAYHAWINTYSETEGWMDSVIYFDGTSWKLMDPTFASSSNSSESVMQYIGDGTNYLAKYLY